MVWCTLRYTLFAPWTFEQAFDSDLNFQLDAVPKQEASIQQRMELQKEVDALKVRFQNQVGQRTGVDTLSLAAVKRNAITAVAL